MKKIYALLAITLFFNSCNDLDLAPLDQLSESAFYKTTEDFDGAIYGSYSSIQKFWGTSTETLGERAEYWQISLTTTDDVDVDPAARFTDRDLEEQNFLSSNLTFQSIYSMIYEGILRANIVIEKVEEENELTDAEKLQYAGEAKFLRAFLHFQALKMWGTPPLVTEVLKDLNDLAQPNATQDALFEQILSDFSEAAGSLPETWGDAGLGRATAWAARSYIGKVNIWKQDWPAAITAFEDVITNGPYQLLPNYADVFAWDNENNAESIFEIQFGGPFSDDNHWVFDDIHSEAVKASQGHERPYYWDPRVVTGGKLGAYIPSQDLVNSYEVGDLRLANDIYQSGDMWYGTNTQGRYTVEAYDPAWSSSSYNIKKYRGQRNVVSGNHHVNGRVDFSNERWFRFAELKLLYAEALIEQGRPGDAAIQINDIRTRAGLGAFTGDVTVALRLEKRHELAFEPHRWFDIVRWGIGSSVFGASWNDRNELFPFPDSEITRSGGVLNQNTGY
ncbi:MAG: RagB/SusD family nutrient uptake outer membrane protein [Reichenbachiella sp.]|uniref:RagB/SusD family nutrient uptake outer membrane protein n=1 Tax=Reichenbachiella sp. TaxID=2184521 RepID=UPI003266AE7A